MMCSSPIRLKQVQIDVPCGKCVACLARRISGWSFRLLQEELVSTSSFFITFTYDTDHVPITGKGFMNLDKKHLQLFFKRLRKRHGKGKKITYYAVGEYGSDRYRPHYHVLLFNSRLSDLIGDRYAGQVARGLLKLDGKFRFTCNLWPHGSITVGQVTSASVGYCLKYLMKESRIPLHRNDDRLKEFQLQSKGLGASYMSDAIRRWHLADPSNRYYAPLLGGSRIALPRYFKDKLFTPLQRESIALDMRETMEEKLKIFSLTGRNSMLTFGTNISRYRRLRSTL